MPGWVHKLSFEGPVLSNGKQWLEPGDILLDSQDYLACVELTPGRSIELAVPLDRVSISPVTKTPMLDEPRFYVRDGIMEVKR